MRLFNKGSWLTAEVESRPKNKRGLKGLFDKKNNDNFRQNAKNIYTIPSITFKVVN